MEWKKIEFLFLLVCVYAPATLLAAGIVLSEAGVGPAILWFALAIALAILLCYVYSELDDVRYAVMDAAGVSIARRLTPSLMLRLRGKAREYRRLEKEVDRLREEKHLCLSLKRINNINCNSIDEEIKKLEEKRKQVAREISQIVYNYFIKRMGVVGRETQH